VKNIFKILLTIMLFVWTIQFAYCDEKNSQKMSPEESKQFVKIAVVYALENMDPNMDYSKYVSKDFINPIDGEVFNYGQWVAHQKHIKELVKSMKPTFDLMIAEGDHVAAIFHVHLIKKDGSELNVKDMAFFKIKNHKIVYVEELTRLINGSEKDKNIGSTK
jgi:ketosteroid isomerase-like protein